MNKKEKNELIDFLNNMLDENKNISRVYYPGLENHPSHEIAKEQMNDFGAMMSFDLDKSVDVYTFLKSLKLIKPGMSLAGVETTVNFPMISFHTYVELHNYILSTIYMMTSGPPMFGTNCWLGF